MASARLNRLLLLAFLWGSPMAYAADGLVVDEPESQPQSEKYPLQVLGDGFACLHLKWSGTEEHSVNLSLSVFQSAADSDKVAVGLARDDKQDVGSMLPSLQEVKVSANDATMVLLVGSGLAFDKDYTGDLFAEFRVGDKLQKRSWKITLNRPGPVPLFRCPDLHQLINADGTTSIEFQRTAPVRTVGLRLSSFLSKDTRELGVVGFPGNSPGQGLQPELPDYAVADRWVPPIRAQGLTEGATYVGKITFVVEGREVKDCPLELEMPKLPKGELLIDSQSLTRDDTLPFLCCWGTDEPLTVRLRDKTGLRRIDGITATLDGPTASPEGSLDLERHVKFFLNGKEVKKFTEWSASDSDATRTLQPGAQLELKMEFHDLQAGKYQLPLKFTAANAAASSKLDVTVNVRHHWAWAFLAVVLAMVLSWLITSGIVNWRERNRVRDRVVQLQQENFDAHGDFPSVVFLHAVLAQAKSAAAHGLLPVPPSVNDYLQRAERVAAIMRRYRDVYAKLEKAFCTETVKLHYRDSLSEAMGRIGPYPLDDKTRDAILAELDVISARLDSPLVWYWSHVTSEAALLLKQAQRVNQKLGDPTQQHIVDQLLDTLAKPPSDPNAPNAEAFDQTYWFVKLLYSRRTFADENKTLIEKFSDPGGSVWEAFRSGDGFAWGRLEGANCTSTCCTQRFVVASRSSRY
jgi:hypothetical protein